MSLWHLDKVENTQNNYLNAPFISKLDAISFNLQSALFNSSIVAPFASNFEPINPAFIEVASRLFLFITIPFALLSQQACC